MAVAARRDPLSVRYDLAARRVLLAAMRARPGRARIWVGSPGRQFRDLDRGGRTANERALTRAIYYQTWRVPINLDVPVEWSPDLEWGPIENHAGRYGRYLRLRLFTKAGGDRHRKGKRGWRDDVDGTGSWRRGDRRSVPGDRVDSNRRETA